MTAPELRPVRPEDEGAIREVAREAASAAPTLGWAREDLAGTPAIPPHRVGFLAMNDGRVGGFALVTPDPAAPASDTGLVRLAVHPSFRRRGLGRALLRAVASDPRAGRRLECATPDTPEAAALFLGAGFEVALRRAGALPGPAGARLDQVVYAREGPDDYVIEVVERFPEPEWSVMSEALLHQGNRFRWEDALGPEERARYAARRAAFATPTRRLVVRHRGEMVGFSFGRQEGPASFLMVASAVAPAHRRRGLYRRMAADVLAWTAAEGFEEVWSLHLATNRPILRAKLDLGFDITGVQLSDVHGVLVRMARLHRAERRAALEIRAGTRRPTE